MTGKEMLILRGSNSPEMQNEEEPKVKKATLSPDGVQKMKADLARKENLRKAREVKEQKKQEEETLLASLNSLQTTVSEFISPSNHSHKAGPKQRIIKDTSTNSPQEPQTILPEDTEQEVITEHEEVEPDEDVLIVNEHIESCRQYTKNCFKCKCSPRLKPLLNFCQYVLAPILILIICITTTPKILGELIGRSINFAHRSLARFSASLDELTEQVTTVRGQWERMPNQGPHDLTTMRFSTKDLFQNIPLTR